MPEIREVLLEAEGTTYTLCLNTAALVALEGLYRTPTRDPSFIEILQKAEGGSLTYCCGVLWAALRKHHPAVTLAAVHALVDRVGIETLALQLRALGDTTTPDPADTAELQAGRPMPAQTDRTNGSGDGSISTPAGSV